MKKARQGRLKSLRAVGWRKPSQARYYLRSLPRHGAVSAASAWLGGSRPLPGSDLLPSGLLVVGVLPFWEGLRRRPAAQAALRGANAAVVGLLLAALYQPVWTSAMHAPADFILVLAAFGLLVFGRCPPWLVVSLAATVGVFFLAG